MKIETKIRKLLKLDLNGLTPLELQEIKEILKFMLKEKSFILSNSFKNDSDRVPAMFLVTQHQPNFSNESVYDEFVCKVVYVPSVLARCINERGIISFFGFTGCDLDTVVKCNCHNMDISINTFGESNSLRLVKLGLNDLHKIFGVGNTNLANTLIIINGITFETLTFVLLSHGIKLHGGSHSRRHLLQPLELKLAFSVKDLQEYAEYYIQSFIDPDTKSSHELELINESRFKSLRGKINNNYYDSDALKMFLNPEFQDLVLKFKKMLKIAFKCKFSRDVLYTLFLRNYSLDLNGDELTMVLNQKGIDFFNKLLNEVEKRDIGNNKATPEAIVKRGFHTLSHSRSYSSIVPYKLDTDLAKIRPEKILFFNTIKTILQDNDLSTYEAQRGIETQWNNFVLREYEDNQYLVSRNFTFFVKKMEIVKDTLNILENTNFTKRKFPSVYMYLNDIKLIIVTYAVAIYGVNMRLGYNNICSLIGRKVIFKIYCDHIQSKHSKKTEKIEVSIEEFRNSIDFDNTDYIKLGSFLLDLLMTYPVNLFEKSFKDGMYEMAKLEFNETNLDLIRDNIFIDPNSLPMIHEPSKWSDTEYGGYISNKVLKGGLITGSHYHGHSMENRTNIYNAINKMSSIKFNFNKSLLEYFKNEGSFLLNSIFTEEMTKSENLCKIKKYIFLF
uniref:hypothetical protein n=1 Tax=Lentinus flexipes TaxID=3163629 RepID=UPI002264360D|nr:hypothetical protein OSR58_mgp11 [Ganoderma flexipes]UYX56950.1 hypothetical protein [Ganoderma flexipes]